LNLMVGIKLTAADEKAFRRASAKANCRTVADWLRCLGRGAIAVPEAGETLVKIGTAAAPARGGARPARAIAAAAKEVDAKRPLDFEGDPPGGPVGTL
jgi:hypothetical protein